MAKKGKKLIFDHTAPWKCSMLKCDVCKKKPTYLEYMYGKGLTKDPNEK